MASAAARSSTAWSKASEGLSTTKLGITVFGFASLNDAITHAAVSSLAPFRSMRSRSAIQFLADLTVLCWNVRGLNSEDRQRAVRAKIEESECAIVCLQETKCGFIDHRFIRKFCPKRFDNFVYAPSVGASGGILVLWNSAIFSGRLVETQSFGIIVEFTDRKSVV